MGQLATNFQLTLPFLPEVDNDNYDNWINVEAWANQYPGIRLWSGSYANIDSTIQPPFPVVGQILMQGGTFTPTTDGNGDFTLTFPTAFPNSLITCIPTNGDTAAFATLVINAINDPPTKSSMRFQVWRTDTSAPLINTAIRVNWLALGY